MEQAKPKVTVGIPTYNRPLGLKRTLEFITAQTFKDIAIIISDNCSPDPMVKKIAEDFIQNDNRICYYRQDKNIGAIANFKFVLKKAESEYFMWATDDDEWAPTFIETCMKHIGTAGSSMQHNFKTVYRMTNKTASYGGPVLSMQKPTFENIIRFHQNTIPSFMYGVFKRETLLPFLKDKKMDMFDIFFLYRHILNYGINTFDEQLYTAGIDAEDYIFKPIKPSKNRLFNYKPLLYRTIKEIFKCKNLSFKEKIIVSKIFFLKILGNFTNYEKNYRPVQVKIVNFILKSLIFINNFFCKITRSTNYYITKLQ